MNSWYDKITLWLIGCREVKETCLLAQTIDKERAIMSGFESSTPLSKLSFALSKLSASVSSSSSLIIVKKNQHRLNS